MERMLAAAALLGGSAGAAAVWYFNPSNFNFFPVCPLFAFTGFACPGCGMTRGFHALLHGDLITALDYNALIPVFLIGFAALFASLLSVALRGRSLIRLAASPVLLFGLLFIMIVFGVLRNLPFYPFSVLYP